MGDFNELTYKVIISKLSDEDGGGYLATVPSLSGCMSDGNTPTEALDNVKDAIKCWLETARELGRSIPKPDVNGIDDYSGRLSLRIPKYLHQCLSEEALIQNCSINQLIQTYIAMGLGHEYEKKNISIIYNNEDINEKIWKNVNNLWDNLRNGRSNIGILNKNISLREGE